MGNGEWSMVNGQFLGVTLLERNAMVAMPHRDCFASLARTNKRTQGLKKTACNDTRTFLREEQHHPLSSFREQQTPLCRLCEERNEVKRRSNLYV